MKEFPGNRQRMVIVCLFILQTPKQEHPKCLNGPSRTLQLWVSDVDINIYIYMYIYTLNMD